MRLTAVLQVDLGWEEAERWAGSLAQQLVGVECHAAALILTLASRHLQMGLAVCLLVEEEHLSLPQLQEGPAIPGPVIQT